MKIYINKISVLIFLFFLILLSSSCFKKGYGCPGEDKPAIELDDDGNLPTRRGKSHLFGKKMRRK